MQIPFTFIHSTCSKRKQTHAKPANNFITDATRVKLRNLFSSFGILEMPNITQSQMKNKHKTKFEDVCG